MSYPPTSALRGLPGGVIAAFYLLFFSGPLIKKGGGRREERRANSFGEVHVGMNCHNRLGSLGGPDRGVPSSAWKSIVNCRGRPRRSGGTKEGRKGSKGKGNLGKSYGG